MRFVVSLLSATFIASLAPSFAGLPQHDQNLLSQMSPSLSVANHTLRSQLHSDGAKAYLRWRYLTSSKSNPSISEILSFIKQYPDWPRMTTIRHNLEKALVKQGGEKAMTYFRANAPITFDAQFFYLKNLDKKGDVGNIKMLLGDIWRNDLLNDSKQRKLVNAFGKYFTQEQYIQRVAFLLNHFYINQANALRHQLPEDEQRKLSLRTKLLRLQTDAIKDYYAAPDNIQKDRFIQRDIVHYYRKTDQDQKAIQRIIHFGESHDPAEADMWHNHRNVMARVAFKAKQPQHAYDMLKGHGFKKGAKFVSNEWYLGWLALRSLNQPHIALEHFRAARSKSSMPISVARGEYWIGRAHEEIGDNVAAKISYQNASQYFYTYYGQLALVNLGVKQQSLPPEPRRNPVLKKLFDTDPMVQAAYAAVALNQHHDAKRIMLHMAYHKDTDPDIIPLLADMSVDLNLPDVGVKLAKKATTKNMFLSSVGYPLTRYFAQKKSSEAPLFMSLTRQESEYDQYAQSHVGARGLMQLMPATAKRESQKTGQRYSVSRLTSDPDYNVSLGVSYLEGLLKRFDGSYVKSLAGYNAGPSRIPRWVETYGSPSSNLYAAIDWVETIPYSETRNYVQRILETLQIYRARKYNKDHMVVNTHNDLRRGI